MINLNHKRPFIMAKKPVHNVQITEDKRNTIKEMMEAGMSEHLGYSKLKRSDSDNYRNGYKTRQVNRSYD